MKQNNLVLFREKLQGYKSKLRRFYYKSLGLTIGTGGSLGAIGCTWPGSVSIGSSCTIEDGVDFKIAHPFSNDNFIEIGNRTFIGRCSEFQSNTTIRIGNNCLIASQCIFVDVGHEYSKAGLINAQPVTQGPILIEDDVWIGTGTKILQGVVIGKGSIVGAGSIVNKSIPEFQIWAGSPAKFIKHRI